MPTPQLTGLQRKYCFEMADAFYATEAKAHDGFRVQFQWLAPSNMQTVYDAMNGYLDALVNTDADTYTIVVDLINQWIPLRTDTFTFSGQVGSFGNVTYDPEKDRQQISYMFAKYVPIMTFATAHYHKNHAEHGTKTDGSASAMVRNFC